MVEQGLRASRTTIYRNFATREELAAMVLEGNVTQIEHRATELRHSDDGVVRLFDFVLDMQLANRGLAQVLAGVDMQWFTGKYQRIITAFQPLLEQGRTVGVVHAAVEIEDLMAAISMTESITAGSDGARRDDRGTRVRRLLHRALFTG